MLTLMSVEKFGNSDPSHERDILTKIIKLLAPKCTVRKIDVSFRSAIVAM
jgi:hypothetical protein